MSKKLLIHLIVVVGVSVTIIGCEKCSECTNDYQARFRFVDSVRAEILFEVNSLSIVDFNGNNYSVEREATEVDTFFITNLSSQSMNGDNPDTVLFIYDNALIDSVAVDYTFSSDSRCCTNTFQVGKLNFLNRNTARRIKTEYSIYDVIIN